MWYIVRLDSSRVATPGKVRSATLVSSDDPTRVKSNYIPVKTTILRQIERCLIYVLAVLSVNESNLIHTQVNKDLYVEVEFPRQVVNQWENVWKCTVWKNCMILAWKIHVRIGWKYSKTCDEGHLCIQAKVSLYDSEVSLRHRFAQIIWRHHILKW